MSEHEPATYDELHAEISRLRGVNAPFTYDGNANALYYRLTRAKVVRTIAIGDRVNVDVDASGDAVGIEVLNPPGFSASFTTGSVSPPS